MNIEDIPFFLLFIRKQEYIQSVIIYTIDNVGGRYILVLTCNK